MEGGVRWRVAPAGRKSAEVVAVGTGVVTGGGSRSLPQLERETRERFCCSSEVLCFVFKVIS